MPGRQPTAVSHHWPRRRCSRLSDVVSNDSEVGIGVLRQQSDLAQDAIGQRREPVVRALLDEVAAFATDRLQTLLEPATIAWLADQEPIQSMQSDCTSSSRIRRRAPRSVTRSLFISASIVVPSSPGSTGHSHRDSTGR